MDTAQKPVEVSEKAKKEGQLTALDKLNNNQTKNALNALKQMKSEMAFKSPNQSAATIGVTRLSESVLRENTKGQQSSTPSEAIQNSKLVLEGLGRINLEKVKEA